MLALMDVQAVPFRAIAIDQRPLHLVTNDQGDYLLLSPNEVGALRAGGLDQTAPRYFDLRSRGFVGSRSAGEARLERAVLHTRKQHVMEGPTLHIFVVTLRCDHACQYCQVSRANIGAPGYDMTPQMAEAGVERVFESPARNLTVEFQGGEPALRFHLVRQIVELVEARNRTEGRSVRFSLVSTLHHLGEDDLEFCRAHAIHISTSIDGPAVIHNGQRPNPTRDSWQRTLHHLKNARRVLGEDGVTALPTISRAALAQPQAVVDAYRDLGFHSIFLRPISPYGFARKTARTIGYSTAQFSKFYEEALDYILTLNRDGVEFVETYAAIALRHILTPFGSGYVDLRSPAGAGFSVLVYNYDGFVYPADEARMAAETGDLRFRLGTVHETLDVLMASPAMTWLATGSVAEELPGCRDCAFVPYCGADPVYHAAIQGDPRGDRSTSAFCARHMALFQLLFRHIADGDEDTLKTFLAWALGKPRRDIVELGHFES